MKAKSITSGDLESPGSRTSESSTAKRLITLLSTALSFLSRLLLSHSDPHIWFKRDRSGQSWWCVHDPLSGTTRFTTSTELRTWLEQRYYDHASGDRRRQSFPARSSEIAKIFRH